MAIAPPLDLAVLGAVFFIADALAAASVELMAAVLRGGGGSGISLDGHGHETEAEQAGPTGAAAGSRVPRSGERMALVDARLLC